MKTKKFKCDCGLKGCLSTLTLTSYKSNQENNKKIVIDINNRPRVFGLKNMIKLRDWIDCAIKEIETEELKAELKKYKKTKSAKSASGKLE